MPAFLTIGGVVALVIVWTGWIVWGHVNAVKSAAHRFEEHSRAGNLEAAAHVLDTLLEPELVWAERMARQGLWLSRVPLLGPQVKQIRALVLQGVEAARVAGEAVSIMADVQNDVALAQAVAPEDLFKWNEQTPATRSAVFSALARRADDLELLHVRLQEAQTALTEIPRSSLWPGIATARDQFVSLITGAEQALNVSTPFIALLPELGGFDAPRNYLLILQNNTELRPTGGFWGTFGVLTVQNGAVTHFETDDVYVLDGPAMGGVQFVPPPSAMAKYIQLKDGWFFRDANWSPDVPTSVAQALKMYVAQTTLPNPSSPIVAPRVKFDGAILLNPDVVVRVLEVVGPIQMKGVSFDARWFVEALEYQVEQEFVKEGLATTDRKDIIKPLGEELLRRVEHASGDTFAKVMHAMSTSLDENDILLYSTRPAVQRVIEKRGWAGDMRIHAKHDHFMVVDANLAAYKTDHAIRRSYSYGIARNQAGRLVATLRIDYNHTVPTFDYRTTRYRTYTRVYVPLGSELIRVNGALENDKLLRPDGAPGKADIGEEFGATVFGAFTSVEPGRKGTLTFQYLLPDSVEELVKDGTYTLDVQRQGGVGHVPLSLNLNFGRSISYAYPAEAPDAWFDNAYTVSTTAAPFQSFRVGF